MDKRLFYTKRNTASEVSTTKKKEEIFSHFNSLLMKLINHINILKTKEETENQQPPELYVIRKMPSANKEFSEFPTIIKEESSDLQESSFMNQDNETFTNSANQQVQTTVPTEGKKPLDSSSTEENKRHQESEENKRPVVQLPSENDMQQGCVSGGENTGEMELIGKYKFKFNNGNSKSDSAQFLFNIIAK